jgi:hypothetical protein
MKRITVPLHEETAKRVSSLAETNRRGIGPQIAFMLEQHFGIAPKPKRKAKRSVSKTAKAAA